MHNFSKYLEKEEEILWEGKPVPGTGGKNLAGSIILIVFAGIIQVILIFHFIMLKDGEILGSVIGLMPFILVTLLFDGIGIYNIVYNYFLKKRVVVDDFYCLTNKRVFKYESKKDLLVYGYLINYDEIKTYNVKDYFGDVYFGIVLDERDPETENINVIEILKNPNPTNMPAITFESVQEPRQLASLAKTARDELRKNV